LPIQFGLDLRQTDLSLNVPQGIPDYFEVLENRAAFT
jgi:hypothetical protein